MVFEWILNKAFAAGKGNLFRFLFIWSFVHFDLEFPCLSLCLLPFFSVCFFFKSKPYGYIVSHLQLNQICVAFTVAVLSSLIKSHWLKKPLAQTELPWAVISQSCLECVACNRGSGDVTMRTCVSQIASSPLVRTAATIDTIELSPVSLFPPKMLMLVWESFFCVCVWEIEKERKRK